MDPTLEPVVFGTVVEGLRKALGKQFTPALLAKFKVDGIPRRTTSRRKSRT